MAIINDETSRILAEYGTPEKWRQYALWEAERERREAIAAAEATFVPAGGNLGMVRRARGKPSDPAYNTFRGALEAAVLEYDQTCGAIQGEYARVTA